MADRIVRGYWDCPYCDSTDIDGLVDNCPNCGRHKPENTKYHLRVQFLTKIRFIRNLW